MAVFCGLLMFFNENALSTKKIRWLLRPQKSMSVKVSVYARPHPASPPRKENVADVGDWAFWLQSRFFARTEDPDVHYFSEDQ